MFPLLRLPHIAIEEVLSTMSPFELIHFSLINPKTKVITKTCTRFKKNRFEMHLGVHRNPKVSIIYPNVNYDYEWTDEKTKCEKFEVGPYGQQIIHKCSEDVLNGYKKWVEYTLEVLNSEIRMFCLYTDDFPGQEKAVIDWVKSKSKTIKMCEICEGDTKKEHDEIVEYLLENLKITESLDLTIQLSEHFRSVLPKVSEEIFIQPAKWVTLQNILEMDSSKIVIRDTKLENQELYQFFTSWMYSKSNQNISHFQITILSQEDVNVIFEAIPNERIPFGTIRTFRIIDTVIIISGGLDIRRTDGKRATLYIHTQNDCLLLNMITY